MKSLQALCRCFFSLSFSVASGRFPTDLWWEGEGTVLGGSP